MARKVIFFGDVHIPHQNSTAVEVLKKAVSLIKPDEVVCVGDLIDATPFSSYPPTFGIKETEYHDDIDKANNLLDYLGRHSARVIMVEGNHENRIRRWAASTKEGKSAYKLIAPELLIKSITAPFKYLRYGIYDNKYPMYKPNERLIVVHGWCSGLNAARRHLQLAQGRSVVFGHIHRLDVATTQAVYNTRKILEARCTGCLCQIRPFWGEGSPVDWVQGFVLGFLGRHSDTLYSVAICGHSCVLPDGREVLV